MNAARAVVRERVRWDDVDKMDVMYFGAYLRFMVAAEAEFFRAHGFTYDGLAAVHGNWLARVHLAVDYRKPARLDDEVACWAELERIGASSLRFRFPIERAATLERLADGILVLACLNRDSLKPARVPALLAQTLTIST